MGDPSPSQTFRVLTRTRTGYDDGIMFDVQLQVVATGALVWAQTFTDRNQAREVQAEVEHDLDHLAPEEFRRKHSVPSSV